jgi:hypothetical protein
MGTSYEDLRGRMMDGIDRDAEGPAYHEGLVSTEDSSNVEEGS